VNCATCGGKPDRDVEPVPTASTSRLRAGALADTRFTRVWNAGIVGIMITDLLGAVLDTNDAFLAMIGRTRDEIIGKREFLTAITPPDCVDETIVQRARIAADGHALWEKAYLRPDGTRVPVMLACPYLDDGNALVFATDLSERYRAEEKLREAQVQLLHAQKMEAVGRLAGGVAHDFNNMLSVILTSVHMARTELPRHSPVAIELEDIELAATRAAELTARLLLFSRQQSMLEPSVLSLDELIDGMQRMLQALVGESIAMEIVRPTQPVYVRADPGLLEQAVANLAVNARDAMIDGGALRLSTDAVTLDGKTSTCLGLEPGAYVRFAITDNGCGMDEELQARIFEPFFTTKGPAKGTGLGLATVFGTLRQLGGAVRVTSAVGRGSTFELLFPAQPAEEYDRTPSLAPIAPRGGERVLLVEDEDSVRNAARNILRRQGYTVLDARSPTEALGIALLDEAPIHLLLTDVVMPKMSGTDLAQRIRAPHPETRILCMSGYADERTVPHHALHVVHSADGNAAFLQKPLTPQTLARKVRDVLDA
jgi:two-component system cell cycle sensor histidine kinase/response regulator CckA